MPARLEYHPAPRKWLSKGDMPMLDRLMLLEKLLFERDEWLEERALPVGQWTVPPGVCVLDSRH